MFNVWGHIRLVGGIICMVGAFMSTATLSLVGLLFIAVGVAGGLDRIERLIDRAYEKEEDDDDFTGN